MAISSKIIASPFGNIQLVAEDGYLKSCKRTRAKVTTGKADDVLRLAQKELDQFFVGKILEFTIPLDPDGTAFQKKVWDRMMSIPYGSTWSYKQLAKAIGHPNAYRAVGTANVHNPVWIIVPSHRVISASGGIGGYGGEEGVKQKLLDLERSHHFPLAHLP